MRKKLTMLLASLFLVLGTAWAQVVEGQPYYLKVVGVDNAYIDAKNGVSETSGQTITISSKKVPVYFKAGTGDKWKISVKPDFSGGFLRVNQWCANPNQSEDGQTEWTLVSVEGEQNLYYLSQSYYQGGRDPERKYLGTPSPAIDAKLFTDQAVANAVKIELVNPVAIEVTTDEDNPKWYTIKNIRGGAYAYYGKKVLGLSDYIGHQGFLFYFTEGETKGTYKIHNSLTDKKCGSARGEETWTTNGIDWYIQVSGNTSYPGLAISKQKELTSTGSEAWNDNGNNHTDVNWYGGNDDGSTWEITRYEGEVPTIQLSTNDNIVLHYIRSVRRTSYVNFDGHNSTFKEGAQGLASYWYFVEDTEAPAIDGFIACKIFNAAYATAVKDHSSGNMEDNSSTYYIGLRENERYGYIIRRSDSETNGWHDYSGTHVGDYGIGDDGSLWRIYPAGKTGAELKNEAAALKAEATVLIAAAEEADYYSYSDDAIATAKAAVNAIHTEELSSAVSGLTTIPAAMNTLKATEKGVEGPVAGQYIRLKNKYFKSYLAVNSNNEKIGKLDDRTDLATLWKVEAGSVNGSVKLKNVANEKYVGSIVQDVPVEQKDKAEASDLTFSNVAEVYAAFQTTGGNNSSFANYNSWQGGILGWGKDDASSQWIMSQAYPLTIVYKFGEDELDRVEAYVDPATEYTIENNIADKIIATCTANGQPIEPVDDDYIVTVNEATEVVVTLKAEDMLVTGSGSKGTISVTDVNDQTLTEIPAGAPWTISIEVRNPNGAAYSSQWGTPILVFGNNTDTNTFQLYLRSVNNKTQPNKLCLVLNGKDNYIENVTASGNFTATIHYDGDKTVIVETTNLTTGNTVEQTFTASNALPAVSTFSYGLPTGMNIKSLHIDRWVNQIDCPTAATQTTLGGKNRYTFTSQKFTHINNYNKLRFTLTESAAYYEQAKTHKRMSLDEFKLYDANGDEVKLDASWFTGNNSGKIFANMLDGVNNQCCSGTWGQANAEDDWFEITLPNSIDLGGAFSFSFVTENTDMNAKRFTIDLSYEEVIDIEYTLSVNAPEGEEIKVQYDGETIVNGIIKGEVKEYLFTATTIPGYVWNVVIDEENHMVTVTYIEIVPEENPAAVVALVNRIGGTGTSNNFKFVLDLSINQEQETFVIGAEDGKILIKGSTLSALTTGIGWYLNNIAHINIAWNSLNEKTTTVRWDENAGYADLSHLPIPTTEETHTSDAKYRYYLNTCTFGYSMTSWTWTRWQQEIDWMALHGINMPLQLVGLEEVWRTFLTMEDANGNRKYGYTDEEAKAFVAGPAFIAWWAMNNLEGWGGTAAGSKSGYKDLAGAGGVQDDAWYARQKKLAKQIVDAQRGLGMQPVIPGWSGMVPTNFADKSGNTTRGNGGNWAGDFVRPLLLNTSVGASKYAEIAADYYECLHAVMGESQYYSMDPFHEGGGAGTMADYEYMYAAMEAAKPGSQWVIQQWQWSATQKYSLTAVPAGRLIVLDLFSDGSPAFDGYSGYAPQEAVFCAIPNFGGRSGLMGRLQNVTDNYFKFKGKYESIKGIGTAPEAIEQTPVTYDLIFQLPWMNGVKPDVAEWVDNYAVSRYGKDNAVVKEAWSLLRQGPLNYGADGIQGPVEDVWAARPNLDANKASSWGKTLANAGHIYTPARRQMLIDAVYKLIDQEDELELENGSVYKSNYMYDLVEFGGAVMADYAYDLLLGIKAAKNAGNTALYEARRDAFLQLILDMDAFRGTNLNFRLGKWTQEARDAATEVEGATTATPDWYEYNNARTILSTWSSPGTDLTDYSYRSWQGLLKDYYYKRWKYYFDNNCTDGEYKYFEWNWAHGKEHYVGQTGFSNVDLTADQDGHTSKYTREPEGNTVEEAVKMLGKYIIPVAMADGTHYAYRYLTNDLSSKVTIIVTGSSIDLTKYFGALEGATVTGEFIDGEVTNLANIAVKSDLTEEAYTGTITLADGTVLTFGVSLNPDFYGVYRIKREGKPAFIGYHDYNISNDKDNGGVIGYKLLDPNGGKYVATATADEFITIMPSGNGYSISAQGQYLKSPTYDAWKHLLFSENKDDAGVYIFEETNTADLFKIKSPTSGDNPINYVNSYGNAFGNDKADKSGLSTFTIEEVTTYAVIVPEGGYLAVCLPFNVVLPAGMTAYDVTVASLTSGEDGAITTLQAIATEGQILKAGTPALLKATANTYNLTITMENNEAKTSSHESKLRGNFVKQTLQPGTNGLSKFVLDAATGKFELLDAAQDIPANTCWIEAKIDAEHVEVTEHKGKIVKVDDWLFEYDDATNGIKLKDVAATGDGNLEIKETFTINGKTQKVVAITPDFLENNKDVTEITLPSSLVNLGFRKVIPMFETSYEGEKGDTATYDEFDKLTYSQGMHRCLVFPEDPDSDTDAPFKVSKDFAWKLTLDVTIDRDSLSYNQWGSSIVSTKPNSLDDYYHGFMQIYMKKDLQHIVVKIDNADDRYSYSTEALDEDGNVLKTVNGADSLLVNRHFTFELEHDGSGGYQVVIYYDNGKAKMYNITASENNKVGDFDRLYYSLPEGIHVNVKFDKLTNEGLFVGCTNLKAIHVHPDNPTFSSCEHGVLYDKNKYYVMRIPEGETSHHFEIPSKVVKLYPGSIHGVSADIVLHSNPEIAVVAGHEHAVENAKFFLSLDDKDNTITEKETGYGGARDFISTNNNTYQSGRYKRAPLEAGKYGTIVLPFAPTNWKEKYDFFEMTDADATSFHFSQVDELQPNTAYLYKLKENPGTMDMEGDTLDVFETEEVFTVQTHAKYNPNDETPGDFRALGAYVNYYIDTKNYPNSNYYTFSVSRQEFNRITKKLNYRPYRALFVVTPEQPGQAAQAPAKLSLRITRNDGSTTEIDPSQVEGMETPIYYDLQGRRVENPTSGVYIVNGKKVVIR